PVLPQGAQVLPALPFPDIDGAIITATGEPLAVRAALEGQDGPLMRLSHPYALQVPRAVQVPPAQPTIAVPTDQHRSAPAPGQRVHDLARLAPGVQVLPTARIPDEQVSTAHAPTTTGQPRPIQTPGHACHNATMLLQFREQRAVGGLPQAYAAIIAAT